MQCCNLHSNMVRFIIHFPQSTSISLSLIYIPIWLDLLYLSIKQFKENYNNLHSNMVRFIMITLLLHYQNKC